jgi:SOS-response transcriptional repressor LexA
MNKAGINDGDLVLCKKDYHPKDGSNVVALIGDDATIKELHRDSGVVILKPCSSNSEHKFLRFTSDEEIKIQGVVVRVLDKLI